jgi:hypothetical protein
MAIAVLTADPEFEQSVKSTFGANAQIDLTLVSGALAGREDKLDFAGARVVVLDIDASQDSEVNALQRLMQRASSWPPRARPRRPRRPAWYACGAGGTTRSSTSGPSSTPPQPRP